MKLFREVAADRWDRDGRRWFLTKLIGAGHPLGPMLRRYMIFQGERFGVYVHRIYRPDADRDCHNHPWQFRTLVLRGGYTELVRRHVGSLQETLTARMHRPGSTHAMPVDAFHQLVEVAPNTWTLLLVGPKVHEWGFWVTDMPHAERPARALFVPWRAYGSVSADPLDA